MKNKILLLSVSSFLIFLLIIAQIFAVPTFCVDAIDTSIQHKSSVLMEKETGKVLDEKSAYEHYPIASMTKLMTILLTLEKIDLGELNLTDKVNVSENANGMGGSQIFLDANAEYELGELLKSVIVASANDSSVAIAEHIAGSENNFVRMMNQKALELGMQNTNYVNCTGLPAPNGYSCAFDQAILLSKVLDYDTYHTYSSIWNEDFVHPNGRTTQMTNTNKLSRFYEGCLGGKTGSTNEAKFCLAVGAERNNLKLISVVIGVENSKDRFKLASDMLNYGFENFETKTLFSNKDLQGKTIKIKGMDRLTTLKAEKDYTFVCKKNENVDFNLNFNLPNSLIKVKENDVVGNVEVVVDGVVVDTINILSNETHNEASVWDYFKEIIRN